jgi:ketosteroid isomerase-like protein
LKFLIQQKAMVAETRRRDRYVRCAPASAAIVALLGCQTALAGSVGEQIIAALEHYRVAVVELDIENEMASFAEDAELSQGSDPPVHGRTQIRALLQSQAGFKVVDYDLHTAVTRVHGPVATQNGIYSQRIISPQHESRTVKGMFEVQWSLQSDGSWLISRLHTEPVENTTGEP